MTTPSPPSPFPSPSGVKEYTLSTKAKESGIKRIYDRLGSDTKVIVEFSDEDSNKLTVDFENKKFSDAFRTQAEDLNKNTEMIKATLASLYNIEIEKMEVHEIKQREERQSTDREAQEKASEKQEEIELKKATVCKYSGIQEGDRFFETIDIEQVEEPVLFESVNIGGNFNFVCKRPGQTRVTTKPELIDRILGCKLVPYKENSHYPFMFASEAEINEYIDKALSLTFYQLWVQVHKWVSKCYDTDDQDVINLTTAMIIFTYFADKIGITPYIFFVGEPGTGKGSLMKIIELLGYRVSSMSLSRAAAVYRLLGDIEKGQVSMKLDELNNLENDPRLLETLKLGYKGDEKIPINFDVMSAETASMKNFYVYCPKFFAAEHMPNPRFVGGFMTRTFFVGTSFGVPDINIEEIASATQKPAHREILKQIEDLRKLLLAFRLVHFNDDFDYYQTGLHGRQRELCIGNLTLFKGTEVFDTVKRTFYHFIEPQVREKQDSLNVHVATVLKHLGKAITSKSKDKNAIDENTEEILMEFQRSYNVESQAIIAYEKDKDEGKPVSASNIEPAGFGSLEVPSTLVWEALRLSLNAEEVSKTIEEESNDGSKDNKNKKKRSSTPGVGQTVLRSKIYSDISWSWLAIILKVLGCRRNTQKHKGRHSWTINGNRLGRYERSYRLSLIELDSLKEPDSSSFKSGSTQNEQVEGNKTQTQDIESRQSRQARPLIIDGVSGLVENTLEKPENTPIFDHGSGLSGRSGQSGQVNYDLSGNNPATPLLLQKPKPKIIYSDKDPSAALFYGFKWVCWDLEWHPSTSEIYAAAFTDYEGNMLTLHVQDPGFNGDEGKLLDRIIEEITKYPVSFGYYTTGMESYFGKGKNSDLITLSDRLVANGRISPIDIVKPMEGPGRKRPRFAGHLKHTHIDLESIFGNEVVENFIPEENHYRSHKLNYVAKVLSGEEGKLPGMNGLKIIKQPPDVQKNYVLWDAIAVYNIITSKVAKEVIELLNELAGVLNHSLEWVCHTTTTVWWTDILDKAGCERPTTYKEPWTPHGGLNLPVVFGQYEHVVLVDVNSLYPRMAIVHNIGFDTINCECCKNDPLAKVPRYAKIYSKDDKDGYIDPNMEYYWICRKRSSKFREKLIAFRDKKDEASKNGHTMRKKIYKLLMNSAYGAHNTNGFGYLFPPVCDLITGFGRYTLRVMRAVAISMGYQIIAGDTDSIFFVGMKTKEDLERFQNRCQDLLRVHDPSLDRDFDVLIENKIFDTAEKAPISFEKFYCAMKKHYYGFTPGGKYDGTKMEVDKDDRPAYSKKILWEQWKADLKAGKNPIDNFKRLTSEEELRNVLENDPEMLKHSSKLGENPGYADKETGEIKECTYSNVNDPKAVIGRELGLGKNDIAYFFKAGNNKSTKKNQKLNEAGNPIGTFTISPKYASIKKIREDLIEAFIPHIRIILNRPILKGSKEKEKENKLVDKQIKKEVFGI